MKISTGKYFLSDSFKSIGRNRTLSLASMFTVAAALFIFGIFVLTGVNVSTAIKNVESKVQVEIFLKDDITDIQRSDLEAKINSNKDVLKMIFQSKSDAMERFKNIIGKDNPGLISGISSDILPTSFVVTMKKPEQISALISQVTGMPGIDTIENKKDFIEKIVTITNGIKWIGAVVFIILGGVALFLISNTIKITVYSRRREISIMKFIGATDWFIRWPFIIEGMIIGIVGSLISTIVLFYTYGFVVNKVVGDILTMIPASFIFTYLVWIFLACGVVIGAIGSAFAIRKFLVV
ncbi:MAG TPA: permease-like cell division protein FtsX [Clostridiaceae bacterium]